jgi:GINS complex subunit 1
MCWAGVDAVERGQEDIARMGDGGENGVGGAEGDGANDAGSKSSLSPEEEEYVRNYSDLLAAYKGRWTDVDLTGSLEPPRDLFIDVRVLKDAGEIQTEYG